MITNEERFWARVQKGEECWEWDAPAYDGYGRFFRHGRQQMAHRVSYELLVGPIPVGHEVDHLCRVRGCVNPAHLEAVTQAENARRAGKVERMRASLAQEIVTHVKGEIAAGRLKPGDELPTVPEFARAWNCSHEPVRRALRALRIAGLIVTRQGRRAVVAPPA